MKDEIIVLYSTDIGEASYMVAGDLFRDRIHKNWLFLIKL